MPTINEHWNEVTKAAYEAYREKMAPSQLPHEYRVHWDATNSMRREAWVAAVRRGLEVAESAGLVLSLGEPAPPHDTDLVTVGPSHPLWAGFDDDGWSGGAASQFILALGGKIVLLVPPSCTPDLLRRVHASVAAHAKIVRVVATLGEEIVSQTPPTEPDLADRVRAAAAPAIAHRKRAETDGAAAIAYGHTAPRYLDNILAALAAESTVPTNADRVAGHRAQIAEACEMLGLDGNAYVLDAPSLRREIEASWRELGVDMDEVLACDDPDVRLMSQSIRVSLQYEKDKVEMAVEHAVAEERKRAVRWLEGLEGTLGRASRLGLADSEQLKARRGLYDGIARDLERGAHLQDTTKKGG